MDLNKEQYILDLRNKKTKINSERAEVISWFVERLNQDRKGTKYKPLTPRGVAIKLSHIKTNKDLYWFYNRCNSANHFSKFFWYAIKPDK